MRSELSEARKQISSNRENIIAEINNRYKRLNNIVFFNIPEINSNDGTASDLSSIKNILSVFKNEKFNLSTNFDNLVVKRIGYFDPNKIRPICVTFNSRDDVFKIISNQELLPNYKFKMDKTDIQREHLKQLIEERNKHNSLHPQNPLVIKYKNEVPILVNKPADIPSAQKN